jgi:hypothetical protein
VAKETYKTSLDFMPVGEDDKSRGGISVLSISVDGGANRTIDFSSTDPMDIASELEQARTHKNITFNIPANDGISAVILTESFFNKKTMRIYFIIGISTGGSRTKTILLRSDTATILKVPAKSGGGSKQLSVGFSLPDVTLEVTSHLSKNTKVTKTW